MQFLLFLIIDGILKRVSKTVHTLVRRCPRKPWILQRLPSNCSEEKKKKLFQALAALTKAGVSDLDSSVEKETGRKEDMEECVQK